MPKLTGIAVLVFATYDATAQLLDLDRPSPPVLNEPTAIDLAIESLAEQSRNLARRLEVPPRVQAQIIVRDLAADLLRAGDPAARLWGLTIAHRLEAIDAILLNDEVPEAVAILLAADLDIPAFDLPPQPADLDRLIRDAFAELAIHADPSTLRRGWVAVQPRHADLTAFLDRLATWESAGAIDSASAAEIRELMSTAETWPAYADSAAALRARIAAGSAILDQTLSEAAAQLARDRFGRAAADVLASELRADALESLDRLAELAQLLSAAAALEDRDAGRAVIDAVERSLTENAIADFTLARTILGLLRARAELPPEDAIVRSLRPAWRAVSTAARETEVNLAAVLPSAVGDGSAMSDPGVLAPIGLHRASLDDLAIILGANELLADPRSTSREPVVRNDRRTLAASLLDLGQALNDDDRADSALRTLRELGEQVAVLNRIERAAVELSALPDQTAAQLTEEIASARAAWIEARSNHPSPDVSEITARLDVLAAVAERTADLTLLTDGPLALHVWPAFELPPELGRIVMQQAADRLDETALVLLGGDLARADERLESYDDEHRILALLAELERGLRARELARRPGVTDLVASAPPQDAWLASDREALAELSLLLAEIPGARHRNEPRAERDIRRYANELAGNLIEAVADGS